ncbi:bifunctional hydroxymethylpyrimidine kinase/phosphomethylpyrimidine kinase [bacterium]|nr:bifunctional hydroxymethylpyrimidine kinase/phosphomethylpyrimidine kinase [bacterium]
MNSICLSIAGSDSSGGAGIQADLKTFASLGCYGATVITALTAQNTKGIRSVQELKPDFVKQQLEAVLEDLPVSAIKIGMLCNAEIVQTVAEVLSQTSIPIILDPIRFSTSGIPLFKSDQKLLSDRLLPLCILITPNMKEAFWLANLPENSTRSIDTVGEMLLQEGAHAVLVTGGDLSGKTKTDCLKIKKANNQIHTRVFKHHAVDSQNTHGTGCTLSSAIAAYLAKGNGLEQSVEKAISYVQACLKRSVHFYTGKGNGGLNHFPSDISHKMENNESTH